MAKCKWAQDLSNQRFLTCLMSCFCMDMIMMMDEVLPLSTSLAYSYIMYIMFKLLHIIFGTINM